MIFTSRVVVTITVAAAGSDGGWVAAVAVRWEG